jgi:hypothetical protein
MKPLLCLDLEGTLISNAVSQIPRPGLHDFLERAFSLCDLVIYTSVSEDRARAIQELLTKEAAAPIWFKNLEVIRPKGTIKHKAACGRSDAFLLDDQPCVIAEGEESWWIAIPEFSPPYPDEDKELLSSLDRIKELI